MTGREAILACLGKYGHFTAGMAIQESGLTKNQITTASFKMRRDGEIKVRERNGKTIVYVACDADDDPPQEIKPMNTRDKILNHLETNIPASAAQLSKLFGCHKSHINLLLRDLVTDGLVEFDSVRKGANFYRLTALHNQRMEAIHRYLDEHETGMAVEIASATGIPKNLVTKTLKGMAARGELHRDWCHKNAWVYSKKPVFNFGAANPLTAFINKALREVRA
ncbi:hypothetical protein I4B40_002094 [Enterobacter cloacae]|nr:hypothetical protein [Enterobacter cloacae]